jgi:hypothetical protein
MSAGAWPPDFTNPTRRVRGKEPAMNVAQLPEDHKWIPGHEGRYAVTRTGDVVSYTRKARCVLSPRLTKTNYLQVNLYPAGQSPKTHRVHRLVWAAFGSTPLAVGDTKTVVAHLDGDRTNNHIDNLIQCSQAENCSHKADHGTAQVGERNPSAKLTADDVREIRRRYDAGGVAQRVLAKEFGVARRTISWVVTRSKWAHI